MQKITKSYDVLMFDELSEEAKTTALDNNRNINTEFSGDYILEEETENLKMLGFDDVKIYYNGFYSQGDGACFEGSLDNSGVEKFLRAQKRLSHYKTLYRAMRDGSIYINIKISHSGHYYHEYMTDTDDMTEMQDNSELEGELAKEWEDFITFLDNRVYGKVDLTKNCGEGWIIDRNREIYKNLEAGYEADISDEAVADTLRANEYGYLADGTQFNG